MDDLRNDPANQWSLTLEEKGAANRETEAFIAETGFDTQTQALAAETFPDDPALQAEAVQNATRLLHHAAQDIMLLPRRQVYQEFARKREEWLTRILGEVVGRSVLYGADAQVTYLEHKNLEGVISGTRPTAELPDFRDLEPTAAKSILQETIGDAAVLARLLMRFAPGYLLDHNIWPKGPAALARSVLRRNPQDLRQALIDAPDIAGHEIVTEYLRHPLLLDAHIANLTRVPKSYNITESRLQDEREVRNRERLLADQLKRGDVHPDLFTAPVGEMVALTPQNEKLSQGTLNIILNANLDVFSFAQLLDSIAEREAERTGMPELSDSWRTTSTNPTNKLLKDFYGPVSDLRIRKLAVDESVLGERGVTVEQIDLRRVVHLRVRADLRSSAGPRITRSMDVLIYPQRVGSRGRARDLITCETRELSEELSGAAAVVKLWENSAARARKIADEEDRAKYMPDELFGDFDGESDDRA